MSQSAPTSSLPPTRRLGRAVKIVIGICLIGVVCAVIWQVVGRELWENYQVLQQEQRAAEDTQPIGYLGIYLRRTYNDKPLEFHFEKDGRKLLWAARGEDAAPEFYDVTEAAFDPKRLSGGFGRDSIAGIDYPILERDSSPRGSKMRARQPLIALVLTHGPRVYPVDLLEKIEIVNDTDDSKPFLVVYDSSSNRGRLFDRTLNGRAVTFGTTGYADEKNPLLYDRRTRSLWLSKDEALVCVNGELKGTMLPVFRTAERTTWSEWHARHPNTEILVGSDRKPPIPTE